VKKISKSADETVSLGREFAEHLKSGDVIGLKGDLGCGKTQFVKGICSYFRVEDDVNSPTFIIANQYEGTQPDNGNKVKINHLDLYRLKKASEIESLGVDNYFYGESITLIEWSELMEEYLGKELKTISFEHGGEHSGEHGDEESERSIYLPE
jgi:tRNA threonylcarbamoyladenosine biosynthesis protein TsaE